MKYVDRRDVQSSTGDYFSCFYTINYNARGVNKKKSSVTCDPNENGGTAIEEIDQSFANKTFLYFANYSQKYFSTLSITILVEH